MFPREGVLRILAADLSARTDPTFAVVFNDYFAVSESSGPRYPLPVGRCFP
jgi:hypothetical protein